MVEYLSSERCLTDRSMVGAVSKPRLLGGVYVGTKKCHDGVPSWACCLRGKKVRVCQGKREITTMDKKNYLSKPQQ